MSNSLSIATVTACLQSILEGAFFTDARDPHSNTQVTALAPNATGIPVKGANIFLYQVTPNAAFRNTDLPTRNGDGLTVTRPRTALDLHYIITFYGDDSAFESQRLLGIAARTFHAQPTMSRDLITRTLTRFIAREPPKFTFLAQSDLVDAPELVRLTPGALTLDELARVWSIFSFQTKQFTPSLVYQASVVLIDKDEIVRQSLPVRIRNVYVEALGPPVVEQVVSSGDPAAPLVTGGTVLVLGRALAADGSLLFVDGEELATPVTVVSANRLSFVAPASLRAGTHGLQVVRVRNMGTPPAPHVGSSSNLAPFVLHPTVTAVTPQGVTTTVVDGQTLVQGTLAVDLQPAVGRRQRVVLTLNERQTTPQPTARSYAISVGSRPDGDPDTSATISVPFQGVLPGSYLVRIEVDGAASALGLDALGQFYDSPQVTLP
jgi:hypothetical protein